MRTQEVEDPVESAGESPRPAFSLDPPTDSRPECLPHRGSSAAATTDAERLQFVLEGSDDGYWDWDVASGRVQVNRRWWELRGLNPTQDLSLNVDGWAETIHPGDVAVVGDRAFVADGSSGLRVVDVSDPGSPSEVTGLPATGPAHQVEVQVALEETGPGQGLDESVHDRLLMLRPRSSDGGCGRFPWKTERLARAVTFP